MTNFNSLEQTKAQTALMGVLVFFIIIILTAWNSPCFKGEERWETSHNVTTVDINELTGCS